MTEEEIIAAYEKIKARKDEEKRQINEAYKIERAKRYMDRPFIFEDVVGEIWDDRDYRYQKLSELDDFNDDLNDFIDRLPKGCKVRVTIEIIQP